MGISLLASGSRIATSSEALGLPHMRLFMLLVSLAATGVGFFPQPADAQVHELQPEVDAYIQLVPSTRLWIRADRVREEGNPIQTQIGASLQFNLKPLLRLRALEEKRPDLAKERVLTLAAGYRFLSTFGKLDEHRVDLEASPRYPLVWKIVATDRNLFELRFISREFAWRYRNRLTFERPVPAWSYTFFPYLRGEAYYSSLFNKWNETSLSAGAVFPIKKHVEFEPYLQYENQTSTRRNQQFDILGLTLRLFF